MAIYDNLQKGNASMFPLQEKSATPTAEEQIIEADPDHYGLSKVTVAAAALQEKSATPTAEEQTIEADSDHYGLSKVTVAAAKLQSKTVTPANEKQTIKPGSGYYGLSKVVVEATEEREIVLQAKAVDPTESTQLITPDPGYDGLSSVAVGPIPETEIKLQEKTVTPTSEVQIVEPDEEYDGLSAVTVNAIAEIPDAESAFFGKNESDIANGISYDTVYFDSNTSAINIGNKFTALDNMRILGLRVNPPYYAGTLDLRMWGNNQELIRKVSCETTTRTWSEVLFDSPINIMKGESFIVGLNCAQRPAYMYPDKAQLDSRLQFDGTFYADYNTDNYPTGMYGGENNYKNCLYGLVDVIIGVYSDEEPILTYDIATSTMDSIANEVKRITNTSGKISIAQIIESLKSISATA